MNRNPVRSLSPANCHSVRSSISTASRGSGHWRRSKPASQVLSAVSGLRALKCPMSNVRREPRTSGLSGFIARSHPHLILHVTGEGKYRVGEKSIIAGIESCPYFPATFDSRGVVVPMWSLKFAGGSRHFWPFVWAPFLPHQRELKWDEDH